MRLKWIDANELDGICKILCKTCDVWNPKKISRSPVDMLLKSEEKQVGESLGTGHTNLPPKLSSYSTFLFFQEHINEEKKVFNTVLLKHAHMRAHTHTYTLSATWVNNNLIFKGPQSWHCAITILTSN